MKNVPTCTLCFIAFVTDTNTSMEKVLKTPVGRKTTVAQYLSSSASATPIETTQSFCSYPHRACMRNKLEGFDYCIRHILEDRNAPYKQCSYVSSRTGHKCPEAALKTEKRERSFDHFVNISVIFIGLACILLSSNFEFKKNFGF